MDDNIISMGLTILEVFDKQKEITQILSSPPEKQINIMRAIGIQNPKLNIYSGSEINCSYPMVSKEIAAKIVLGIPIGVGLTTRERHKWLTAGAKQESHEWLLRDTGLEARSLEVARWLLKILANPQQKEALYKRRRDGVLAEHTIDLFPGDCHGGVKEAIARRADRMAVTEYGAETLCEEPQWINPLGGRIVVLRTAPALEREGREMSHCVGGYASSVKNGHSVIASVRGWGYRATVEYNPKTHKIVQISGRANATPHPVTHRLAELATEKPQIKFGGLGREAAMKTCPAPKLPKHGMGC